MKKYYQGLIIFWIYSTIILSIVPGLNFYGKVLHPALLQAGVFLGNSLVYLLFAIYFLSTLRKIDVGKKGIFRWTLIFCIYRIIVGLIATPFIGVLGLGGIVGASSLLSFLQISLPVIAFISLIIALRKKKNYA